MTIIQGILLGALQGLTEFLPVSSSGHLTVCQSLFGLTEIPLIFDVFLHLATLLVVLIYFWEQIWNLLKILGRWITKKSRPQNTETEDLLYGTDQRGRKTIIAIIISTIVTGIIGILTSKLIPELPVKFTCAGFLITACILISSSIYEKKTAVKESKKEISVLQALFIGLMQGFGTLPGISRSGSTISGALFSKVDRKSAGDYSFIVSIPAILGAFILEVKDIGEMNQNIGAAPVIAGCISAALVGALSLIFLMKLIRKGKLQYFSAYLIPLGILGLIFF